MYVYIYIYTYICLNMWFANLPPQPGLESSAGHSKLDSRPLTRRRRESLSRSESRSSSEADSALP